VIAVLTPSGETLAYSQFERQSTKSPIKGEKTMNLLERAIDTNRRRLEEMQAYPDPLQLKSTRMGLELEIESYGELLEAWRNHKPILTHFTTSGLARAMGAPHMLYQDALPSTLDPELSARLFQVVSNMGIPQYMCDTFTLPAAAVEDGLLPRPLVSTSGTAGSCRVWMYHMKMFAEHFGAPTFDIDTPIGYNEDSIKYLAEQLSELVKFVEDHVPGLKYDENRLIEIQKTGKAWVDYALREYEARKSVPLPMTNMDSAVCVQHFDPSLYPDSGRVLEYWHMRVEELEERAARGAEREEKLRVIWLFPIPLYFDIFSMFDRLGVSLAAMWLPPWGAFNGWRSSWGDDKEFGRKLTPLEEEARYMLGEDNYKGSEWADNVIKMCRDLSCDAVVYHECIGCSHIGGLARLVTDTVERELGLPTYILKRGRCFDPGVVPAMEKELAIFLDTALSRKGSA